RRLERPSHPGARDLVRLQRQQVDVAVARIAGAMDQPGERVDQGGLPSTVGTDEEMDAPLQEGDVHPVIGLEPVEVNGEIANLQVVLADHAARSFDFSRPESTLGSDVSPPGSHSVTTMNSSAKT